MKTFTQKIYLFLSISLIAGNLSIVKANNNSKDMYKTLWEEVKKLENQALPKSALEKVEEIYALALKEGVDVQIVKASIYRLKYTNILEEDGYKKAILKLESEISKTSGAAKSMLHLLLGKMYSTYYYNNAYLINQRSVTYDFDLSDLQTWDKTRFQDKIIKNYFQAIDKTLEQIDIIDFEELITEAENSKPRFETLFDFVVYTAIKDLSSSNYDSWQYYTFNETNEYKFKNESFFTEAEEFTKIKLSYDTLSFNYSILKLYQDWLEIKLTNSDNLASLIMVDIDRLDFVLNNFNSEEKENLWLESVEKLHTKYSDKPELMYIVFKLALYYEKLAKQYDFENPLKLKYKDYNKNAIALINEALEKFPQAYYYKECENIKIRIEKTSLSFTSEKITSSGNKFPLRISYKNLEEVYITVLSLDYATYFKLNEKYYSREFYEKLIKASKLTISSNKIILPKIDDYNFHSTDYLVDDLSKGFYVIILHAEPELEFDRNYISYNSMFVSDLALTKMEDYYSNNKYYVVNRKTGSPINAAKVQVYKREYSSFKREYVYKLFDTMISDENGEVILNDTTRYYYENFRFDISKDDDYLSENFYNYSNKKGTKKNTIETKFFIDRGIYRPGQTVYYKGICIEKYGENAKLLTNYTTNLFVRDVNQQEIYRTVAKTNEFGSFNGSFTIPLDALTGDFSIQTVDGSIYFKVEEYKRPNFEVKALPIEGEYKINDSIKVEGKAMTYAGTALTDAKVKYTVVRNPIWRGYYPVSVSAKEIAYGDVNLDENGKFEINFKAIAEDEVSDYIYYIYNIMVSVTDINGETQQTSAYVYISNTALFISQNLSGNIDKSDLDSIKINSTNISGNFVPANVDVEIFKLKDPDLLLSKRMLAAVDTKMYSKDEWYAKYPGYEYEAETKFENWEVEKSVFKSKINTENTKKIKITEAKKWEAGVYRIVLKSKDKWGNEISDIKNIVVYSSNSKKMPYTSTSFFEIDKNSALVGEKVNLYIGSSFKDLEVFYTIVKKGENKQIQKIKINSELKKIEIPIDESCRGGLSVNFMFIKDNRLYSYSEHIDVPWDNKKLSIKFTSFRDKTLPNSNEEWTLKILDNKNKAVETEVLASMYDASLDVFKTNYWSWSIYPSYGYYANWLNNCFTHFSSENSEYNFHKSQNIIAWYMPEFNLFGLNYYNRSYSQPSSPKVMESSGALYNKREESMGAAMDMDEAPRESEKFQDINEESTFIKEDSKELKQEVQIRSNFNETAFFFPNLVSDENAEVSIKFTVPESLTRWNFMGFAHTKDLKLGSIREQMICQKELMLMPNYPRFFREGDEIELSAKINNISEKTINGKAKIEIYDPVSLKNLNSEFLIHKNNEIDFTVESEKNTNVSWTLSISNKYDMIGIRIIAEGLEHSDGEERIFPVLSNRMLVTETMPLPVRKAGVTKFNFQSLENNNSKTLQNHSYTLEFTSNPAWYAVQALPYLMEYPYECSEQIFSRFYANSLARHIANSNPKIKRVFDIWRNTKDSDMLYSNLEKNQELKSLLLEETPWVLQAKDESIRKKQIALLFDLSKMNYEKNTALQKLIKQQKPNGGWPWFEGMPESWYISQHIVAGLGHLDRLKVEDVKNDNKTWEMTKKAIEFIDGELAWSYKEMKKYCDKECMEKDHLDYMGIHYLYARSFFIKEVPIPKQTKEAYEYYMDQAEKYWLNKSFYMQGMLALALNRNGKTEIPQKIINSLKEHALHNDEMGMYWKNDRAYYWYQAPIETQALLIEVFDEVANDLESVDEMKVWLLKQKQTQDWKTSKATVEAIYALLLRGTDILADDEIAKITIGSMNIDAANDPEIKTDAGTGYFKKAWDGSQIQKDWADISVEKSNNTVSWGAVYWQYFEQLDNIKSFDETALKINKKLFVERRVGGKSVIVPIEKDNKLNLGDKIKVRIEIRVDRDMEYVHLKDMRASCFEPVDYISGYRYKAGLGYYQEIKDAAMNFFIDYLRKGTYVFEYNLIVAQKGDFS
ncbi:MAG: alpha-2-macroglobulin family protein, partial [Bacteroidales bacterium]|nr:alpha-2-macroglobulin family protein [Bacteroidales bacterium]